MRKRKFYAWVVVLVVILGLAWVKHNNTGKVKNAPKPILVITKPVQTANVPVYIDALGTITPTTTVTLKTQINGLLMRVLFREGQRVSKGDLLAEIDARPYEAQLMEYQGQLERDRAQLVNAEIDLKRYQMLWKQNSISQQTLATQQALVNQLQGTIKLDQGLIETTKVNLIYCKITSPLDGRVGLRLVDAGNFVQTSDTTGIAVIDEVDPITVIFIIPEDNVQDILSIYYKSAPMQVKVYDRQQNKLLSTGEVYALDNQIDSATGTVKLRASLKNDHDQLFPGQFVNVKMLVKTLENVLVIPTSAMQYGPKGTFVYALKPDQTVTIASVKAGITSGEQTTILSGLSKGQQVVVEGTDKLVEGSKVTTADQTSKKSAAPSGVTV